MRMDLLVKSQRWWSRQGSPLLHFCIWIRSRSPLRQVRSRDAWQLGANLPPRQITGTPAVETTSQRRDYQRHRTPLHLDFVVDEIEAAVQRAVLAGARLEKSIATYKRGKLHLWPIPSVTGSVSSNSLGEAMTRSRSKCRTLIPMAYRNVAEGWKDRGAFWFVPNRLEGSTVICSLVQIVLCRAQSGRPLLKHDDRIIPTLNCRTPKK
jgi:hypothetical protein